MSRGGPAGAAPAAGIMAGPGLVAAAAVLWGTVGIASKLLYGLVDVTPLVVGCVRLALAVPVLLVWCWWRLGAETFRFSGPDRLRILGVGAAMALYQVCYFNAVAGVGVALATLISICAAPVLVVIAATVLLRERITRRLAVALAVGVTGAVLLVGAPVEGGRPAGIAWAAAAAVAYAAFVLCSRMVAGHDPGKIIVVGFGSGALMLAPLALSAGTGFAAWPPLAWAAMLYIGLVPTALAYVLFFAGMRGTPATRASMLSLAEPLTATAIAVAWLGERLEPPAPIGPALLMATLLLLLRRE